MLKRTRFEASRNLVEVDRYSANPDADGHAVIRAAAAGPAPRADITGTSGNDTLTGTSGWGRATARST
ncbi:MAG TPA: hypothetical protein VEW71_01755 [Allosphingosinicella sp.]|nr:hypothetical protein [Allosphingosinicella sp.]